MKIDNAVSSYLDNMTFSPRMRSMFVQLSWKHDFWKPWKNSVLTMGQLSHEYNLITCISRFKTSKSIQKIYFHRHRLGIIGKGMNAFKKLNENCLMIFSNCLPLALGKIYLTLFLHNHIKTHLLPTLGRQVMESLCPMVITPGLTSISW